MAQRRRSGRPTISDVAQRAGVSAITVSRALRKPEQVSAERRERIANAIRELNYVPDPQASVLASGRSNVIGVVLPSLTNNVYADVLQGIYDRVEGSGFQVQIGNTRYSVEEEDRLVRLFAGQRPAAMLITGLDQSSGTRRYLRGLDVPLVQIMEHTPEPIDMLIGFSHVAAARAAVAHLLDGGYRGIGFLGARMDRRMLRRCEGYRAILGERRLYAPEREVMTKAPSSVSEGRKLCARLLEAAPDTDAVFCANDDLALGALFECQARGLQVPEQVGIVGFNDLEMMAAAVPSVTSIQTHRYQMGSMAIDMLIRRIEGESVAEPAVDLGFTLVPRQSTDRRASGGRRGGRPAERSANAVPTS
jgi:LacI family gluconate utilization system Gnt-I transcriptional repressor